MMLPAVAASPPIPPHTLSQQSHPSHPSPSSSSNLQQFPQNFSQSGPPNTSNSNNSSPNLSNKSTPVYNANIHSSPGSPKNTALELKARAKGKARATYSPTTGSPLHQQQHQKLTKDDAPSKSTSAAPTPPTTPPRPSTKDLHLEQYVTRDLLHAAALTTQSNSHLELIRSKRREAELYKAVGAERRINPGAVFGPGYQGFGNGHTDGPTRILYPYERKRPGNRRSRDVTITRKQLKQQSEVIEDLVPVRLEVDFEKIKLRDTFTWNLHDRTIPIELFAENLVEDYHLPSSMALVAQISRSIAAQIQDYHPHVYLEDAPLDPHLPYSAYKNDEMRVLIKLNISIGNHTLIDQFEWDINNPNNSPEDFALLLTRDLSLSGEFTTAIAHSIREQAQLYSKYLYFIGYPFDGRPIEDEDLRQTLLSSPLPGVLRPALQAKEYSPSLWELSPNEIDRAEKSLSREARKNKRRLNRRGGPPLPDLKEIPKTNRSQIVSSVLPGAVEKVSDMRIITKDRNPGDSESDDSDSEPDPTPMLTPALLAGMTRRQRQSAIAASSALRMSANRSATPEVFSTFTNHRVAHKEYERRPGIPLGYDSLVVRLRVGREKLANAGSKAFGRRQQQQQQPPQIQQQQQVVFQQQPSQFSPVPQQIPPQTQTPNNAAVSIYP